VQATARTRGQSGVSTIIMTFAHFDDVVLPDLDAHDLPSTGEGMTNVAFRDHFHQVVVLFDFLADSVEERNSPWAWSLASFPNSGSLTSVLLSRHLSVARVWGANLVSVSLHR